MRDLFLVIWFFVALGCVGCVGCQSGPPTQATQSSEEVMLAKLSLIRSHHRRSEIALRMKQPAQALEELEKILKIRFPATFRAGQEALLDAWARKAALHLQQNQQHKALQTIDEGLSFAPRTLVSFYVAHLHHVRGKILEAMGRYPDAMQAYQNSIKLNNKVIQRARQQQKEKKP